MCDIRFTKIERHPLRKAFMLYCPISFLPPFFGSYKECKDMRVKWEEKLRNEFYGLEKSRQNEIIAELEMAGVM